MAIAKNDGTAIASVRPISARRAKRLRLQRKSSTALAFSLEAALHYENERMEFSIRSDLLKDWPARGEMHASRYLGFPTTLPSAHELRLL